MKQAILVFGPEASGTRLATKLLMAAGAAGSADHYQPFDLNPPRQQDLAVWRRSFPHDREWPDVGKLVELLASRRYRIDVVVTVREIEATIQSQLAAPHVPLASKARDNISAAYKHIFMALTDYALPYVLLSYESVILHPQETAKGLYRALCLTVPDPLLLPQIRDENAKHYV